MSRHGNAEPFLGSWKITAMELWDSDYIDLVVPGFFAFRADGVGEFEWGAVQGWTDCRFAERDGRPLVEFSWQGNNDGDDASGRGWAVRDGDRIEGRFFFHQGDASAFTAELRLDDGLGPSWRKGVQPRAARRRRR
jgi:hypothetical protein